jgi:hypothetical protein
VRLPDQQQALKKNEILASAVFRAGVFSSRKKIKCQEARPERGFTYATIDGVQRSHYLFRSEILTNDNVKPVKLTRHAATKHAQFKTSLLSF